jgi:hypothetical protein
MGINRERQNAELVGLVRSVRDVRGFIRLNVLSFSTP